MRTRVSESMPHWYLFTFVIAVVAAFGFVMLPQQGGQAGADPLTTTTEEFRGAIAVAAGGNYSCALMSGGTVQCWGSNSRGQLGDGTLVDRSAPAQVVGLSGATALAAGGTHMCALMSGGTVQCWGSNSSGQLGDGTLVDRSTPAQVVSLSGVTALAAGGTHTCAAIDNTVQCWGDNHRGQLGDGTYISRSTPKQVLGKTGFTTLTGGGNHTCGVNSGLALCWGENANGQLGTGTEWTQPGAGFGNDFDGRAQHTPQPVVGLAGRTSRMITAISPAAGRNHTCALMSGGTVQCWGLNQDGQLGDDRSTRVTPTEVMGIVGVSALATGGSHTCALMSGSTAQCWGYNTSGQLGDGLTVSRSTPTQVTGLVGAIALASGGSHTCALMSGSTVKCWGYNRQGQLGDDTTTSRSTPTLVGLRGATPPTTPQTPEPSNCKQNFFLAVRGSGETPQDHPVVAYETERELGQPLPSAYPNVSSSSPDLVGFGTPVASTYRGLLYQADRLPSLDPTKISARAIAYPASPVPEFLITPSKYLRSVTIGAENLRTELQTITSTCPNGKVVLAGYSQGADVINAAMALEQRADESSKVMTQVRKIALMGDPSHLPNRSENVGAGGYGTGNGNGASIAMGIYANDAVTYKDTHQGLVASICTIGDIVCDASSGNLADVLSPVTGADGAHTLYPSTKMRCPAVGDFWQSATDCAAQLLVAGLGFTPVAREVPGPTVTDTVVTVGNHIYAAITGVPVAADGAVKAVDKLLRVWFKSDPIDLGVVQLDDQGNGIIEFDVPDVPPGQHHLEFVASDGRTFVVPIYVSDDQGTQESVVFAVDGRFADVPPTTVEPEPSNPGLGSAGSLQFPFGS